MDHHQDSEPSDGVGLGEVDMHTLSTNTGRVFTSMITACLNIHANQHTETPAANILSLCVGILHDCNNLSFHFTAKKQHGMFDKVMLFSLIKSFSNIQEAQRKEESGLKQSHP